MPNLKPFRDYSEHDVINLFQVSGTYPVTKGTFVTVFGSGVNLRDENQLDNISPFGNSHSAKFNVPWAAYAAPSGTTRSNALGVTLKDVRTVDENGELLIFRPRKAAEMDVIISGQACPILTRGALLYSGIVGTPSYGSGALPSDAGDGSLKVAGAYNASTHVAKFLGPINQDGYALIEVNI